MFYVTEVAKGKFLYGIVTLGERGQIVIPKEAREQFDIKPGEKLLLVGNIKKGITIVKPGIMKEYALKVLDLLEVEEKTSKNQVSI